jgi:hypothetical protein
MFVAVRRSYVRIGHVLEVDQCPQLPRPTASMVVVPVVGISRLAEESLSAALSMGDRTVAVHVVLGEDSEDRAAAGALQDRWQEWRPDVPLVLLPAVDERGKPSRVLGPAIARYVRSVSEPGGERVLLLVGEVLPTTGGSGRCSTGGAPWLPATPSGKRTPSSAGCGSACSPGGTANRRTPPRAHADRVTRTERAPTHGSALPEEWVGHRPSRPVKELRENRR